MNIYVHIWEHYQDWKEASRSDMMSSCPLLPNGNRFPRPSLIASLCSTRISRSLNLCFVCITLKTKPDIIIWFWPSNTVQVCITPMSLFKGITLCFVLLTFVSSSFHLSLLCLFWLSMITACFDRVWSLCFDFFDHLLFLLDTSILSALRPTICWCLSGLNTFLVYPWAGSPVQCHSHFFPLQNPPSSLVTLSLFLYFWAGSSLRCHDNFFCRCKNPPSSLVTLSLFLYSWAGSSLRCHDHFFCHGKACDRLRHRVLRSCSAPGCSHRCLFWEGRHVSQPAAPALLSALIGARNGWG